MNNVVKMPGIFARAGQTLIALVWNAVKIGVLPRNKYGFLADHLPDEEPISQDLVEVYGRIKDVCLDKRTKKPDHSKLGEIHGVNTKHLVEDIARIVLCRAIKACNAIVGLANDPTIGAQDVVESHDFVYFGKDLALMRAIFDSRCVFFRNDGKLPEYMGLLEQIQAMVQEPEVEVEEMIVCLRRVIGSNPRPTNPGQQVLPVVQDVEAA